MPRSFTLFAAALLALTGCAPRLHYDVDVRAAARGPVHVTLEMSGLAGDSLVLRGFADHDILRIGQVAVEAPGAHGFQLDSLDLDGQGVAVPRLVVRGPLPRSLTVRYDVYPANRDGDAHVGWSGQSFGAFDAQGGFVTGRALFLLPPYPTRYHTRVSFEAPSGWSVVTPWKSGPDGERPGPERDWAPGDLLGASLGFGSFDTRPLTVGRTQFVMSADQRIPPAERARTERTLEDVIRFVHERLGRDLGPRYRIVIEPETRDGDDLSGTGRASGQGATLAPLTLNRLAVFTRRLVAAHLEESRYGIAPHDDPEGWVLDGAAELLVLRALVHAGFADPLPMIRDLASDYDAERDFDSKATLEVPDPQADPNTVRLYTAPLALICLERALGDSASDRSKPGEMPPTVVERAFRAAVAPGPRGWPGTGSRARSFWGEIPHELGARANAFRERYVSTATVLPIEDLFHFAATDTGPTPRRGAAASRLDIVFTANTHGYLENCGCKAGQAGGVAKRATLLQKLRASGAPLLVLDAGGVLPEPGRIFESDPLARQERDLGFAIMRTQGYTGVTPNLPELAIDPDSLKSLAASTQLSWTLANVRRAGAALAPEIQLVRAGPVKVAVIGVLDPPRGRDMAAAYQRRALDLSIEDPVATVTRLLPQARSAADIVIASGRIEPATIRRLVQACPDLDIVISSDDQRMRRENDSGESVLKHGDPPGFLGQTLVLYAGYESYAVGFAKLALDGSRRVADANIDATWLGDSVPDDQATRARLTRFYQQVGSSQAAQASVQPLFPDDTERMTVPYVGAARCSTCHAPEFAQWKSTPHAGAYKTLLDVHRHFQPRCVVCHSVGFRTPTGYKMGDPSTALVSVQCEMCHGPGGKHVTEPVAATIRGKVPEAVCLECHTPDHSDHFVYEDKLPHVIHSTPKVAAAR